MPGWGDLSSAQAMRDALTTIVQSIIDDLRPNKRPGTVLRVYKSGPTFNVSSEGSSPDPAAPPPISLGNPQQVYYADVRLDTGELIRARIQQDVPYARDAAWWDNSRTTSGQVNYPYFIADGVYRNAITVSRVDYSGATVTTIEPDMNTHVAGPPFVPPRVTVEGTAGKYIINEIIRGMSGGDDAFMRGSLLIGTRKAGVQSLDDGKKNLVITQQEFTWYKQGWVGNNGFAFSVGAFGRSPGVEVELQYGEVLQRYLLESRHVQPQDWGKWMIVPPVYETYAPRSQYLSSDQTKNVLLAQIDVGGVLHMYVASADFSSNLFTAPDMFLNGVVTVRSTQGPLVPAVNISLPDLNLTNFPKYVWGYTSSGSVLETNYHNFGRTAYRPTLNQDLLNLKQTLGFGRAKATQDGVSTRLWWDRMNVTTARSVYRSSGFYDITFPAVGTVIPVVGGNYGDAGVITNTAGPVVADGIPFGANWSLYYALPIGNNSGATSYDSNFVFVNPGGNFDIPEHWILIACRPGMAGSATFQMGNGREADAWKTINPPAGWSSGARPLMYMKENGVVHFNGGIRASGAKATDTSINNLIPINYRVGGDSLQLVFYHPSTVGRLDFYNDGTVVTRTPMASTDQIYFETVSYKAEF